MTTTSPSLPQSDSESDRTNPPSTRGPILRFILVFAVLIGIYFAFTVTDLFAQILEPYLRINARVSTWILNIFGENARTFDTSIYASRFSIRIARGCDALDPSALFAAAVLAFPVPLRRKWLGVILGCVLLAVINLIRIVSLYYTGVFIPDSFDMMHHDVWQSAFIFLALFFWMIWAWWATRDAMGSPDAPS